jgi:hypothetical protein
LNSVRLSPTERHVCQKPFGATMSA